MLAPAGLSQSEQRARANSAAEAGFVFVPKDNPAATAAAAAAALNGAPPPHAEGSYRRPNLARNHVAVLLAAFCDAGLFDALVKLSASLIDQRLCVRATVLLEGLYNLAGKVLPIHKVTALAVLPRLLEITTAHQNTSEERLRAKLAIDYLKAVRDKRTHAEASISRKVSTVTEVVPLQQHLPRYVMIMTTMMKSAHHLRHLAMLLINSSIYADVSVYYFFVPFFSFSHDVSNHHYPGGQTTLC